MKVGTLSLLLGLGLQGAAAVPALAQTPAADTGSVAYATPFLPASSWAYAAARRLQVLGLAPEGYDAGTRPVTRREMALLFEAAARVSPAARGYRDRLREEYPAAFRSTDAPRPAVDGRVTGFFDRNTGQVLTGVGYFNVTEWTGVRPLPDVTRQGVDVRASALPFSALALSAGVQASNEGVGLSDVQVHLLWHGIGLWGGRRATAYAPGRRGLVLAGRDRFSGGGVYLANPLTLPGVLAIMGPIRFESALFQLHANGPFRRPWLLAMRGSFAPHRRLRIGLNHVIQFGGAGNTGFTFGKMVQFLIGLHSGSTGEYDDQVASADLRYLLPVEAVLPMAFDLEWAFEDGASAWLHEPGVRAQLDLGPHPVLPDLSLHLTYTRFSHSCCGNPLWYRNWSFREGWTDAGRPLGNPLGGNGDEWRVAVNFDAFQARLMARADGYVRRRGAENLFAPQRAGHSRGGTLQLELRPAPHWQVSLQAELERGIGDATGGAPWRSETVRLVAGWLF